MASPRWCARAWAAIHSGAIYVFRAKRADRVKLLLWDGTGLVLVAKRLETSSFRWPRISYSRSIIRVRSGPAL